MATSAREVLALVRDYAAAAQPAVADAEAAIAALGHTGRALQRLIAPWAGGHAKEWSDVEHLARACRAAAAEWSPRPGRLPDLVGVACDIVGRHDSELGRDERWAVAVEVATAARRCVDAAQRHEPYARVPTLKRARVAAAAVEREAAHRPPAARSGTVLDKPIPAIYDGSPDASVLDAVAALSQALRRDTYQAALPITAALATAAAAEQVSRACLTVGRPQTTVGRMPWQTTPASWQVVQAALVRFDDGSRRRSLGPSPSLAAAVRVHEAVAQLRSRDDPNDAAVTTLPRVAAELPVLARALERAAIRWSREHTLFARAQNLVRREELVPAILAKRVVPIDELDMVPVIAALRVSERLSSSLAAELNGVVDRSRSERECSLETDARWAARLAARFDGLTDAAARPGRSPAAGSAPTCRTQEV